MVEMRGWELCCVPTGHTKWWRPSWPQPPLPGFLTCVTWPTGPRPRGGGDGSWENGSESWERETHTTQRGVNYSVQSVFFPQSRITLLRGTLRLWVRVLNIPCFAAQRSAPRLRPVYTAIYFNDIPPWEMVFVALPTRWGLHIYILM